MEHIEFPPCVILFNGFPGVGKYTIATAFKNKTGSIPHRFIDNHTLIDPVEAIIPGRNTTHYALRKQFREVALKAIKNIEEKGLAALLTACLAADDAKYTEQFEEYVDIAKSRSVPLAVIDIVRDENTNKERLRSEERTSGVKTKLTDVGILDTMRQEHTLLDVKTTRGGAGPNVFPFKLDTTGLSLEESVREVAQFLAGIEHVGWHG